MASDTIEPELARAVQLGEPFEEQAPEQHAEDAHRQEEGRTRGDPACSIRADATTRHNHVQMRVMGHG